MWLHAKVQAARLSSTALILIVLMAFCGEWVLPTALWAQAASAAPAMQTTDALPPIQRTETIAKPPFYKRWWFWTLVAVVVVGGIAAAAAGGGGGNGGTPTGSVTVNAPAIP